MSGIHVVARKIAGAGFSLAGLPAHEVSSSDAVDTVTSLAHQPEIGVLLVEQSVMDELPAAVQRDLQRRPTPIIVPFPGPSWQDRKTTGDALVLDLLQRAIGYRVRLR
jgi:vacuolar-type H+-ATPase subunit F/Vma7